MQRKGHGRGHEDGQGTTHMETVGFMNGAALWVTAHESSIRLQTVHESSIRLQAVLGCVTQPEKGSQGAVPQTIELVYITRVELTVRP